MSECSHDKLKFASFEIGHDTEGMDGSVASGQTLGELGQAIDGLDLAIGDLYPYEGDNSIPEFLD